MLSHLVVLLPGNRAFEAPLPAIPMSRRPAWGCSLAGVASGYVAGKPSLLVSFASAATLSLQRSRSKRALVPIRSSLAESSGTAMPEEPSPSLAAARKGAKSAADRVGKSGRSRGRLSVGIFWKRPLWKRIFFASKKVRSLILLNVLTVIYASDIPVLKEVEDIIDPALFTVVRFVLSAIPFIPFVFQECGDPQTRSAGLELGIWVSLGYLSQSLGLLTSDAGHASFLSAVTVIVVPLIDGMFGATVSVVTWSGALLSLMGIAMLEHCGTSACVGDILNFLSALFFGIHTLRTEHFSKSTTKNKHLALLGFQICIVALSSAIWFLFKGMLEDNQFGFRTWAWPLSWEWVISFPWIPALYTGVFSTGLCLWAEMAAMRNVSATETAIVYGLEPLWGAGFAWFLLGERWGTTEWIGAALVLCGSMTVQILGSTPEKSSRDMESSDCNCLSTSNKQNDVSLSTVLVNSRKNTANLFIEPNQKDKL